jgi:hypothetical protein
MKISNNTKEVKITMNNSFNQILVSKQMKDLKKKGITKASQMSKKSKEQWKKEMLNK